MKKLIIVKIKCLTKCVAKLYQQKKATDGPFEFNKMKRIYEAEVKLNLIHNFTALLSIKMRQRLAPNKEKIKYSQADIIFAKHKNFRGVAHKFYVMM